MTARPHSRIRQALRPRTRWRRLTGQPEMPAPEPVSVAPPSADFVHWVQRSGGRLSAWSPAAWTARTDLPIEAPSRVGVVLHAFHVDLLGELFEHLRRLPVDFDLLVTNATGAPIDVPPDLGRACNVRVLEVENRGRDILPLASVANAGLLDPYAVILKVHTKRSDWRADHDGLAGSGDEWREQFLDALLGSPERIEEIVAAFGEQTDLGLVTADGNLLGPEFWGGNEAAVAGLLRRLELDLDPATLRFAAGSMYWVRGFALQALRSLDLDPEDFEPEDGQVDATTAHAVERSLGLLLREAGLRLEEASTLSVARRTTVEDPTAGAAPGGLAAGDLPSAGDPAAGGLAAGDLPSTGDPVSGDPASASSAATVERRAPRARVVPFYLPQFHPIPENDRWWGTGFTEWTNVTRAEPAYLGHHQPLVPTDLGHYDLRVDDVRARQAAMAREAGVAGLMYYFYWFAGERLLELPLDRLVAGDVDQPFCIMWANENWTRRWDGRDSEVLIGQDHDRVPAAAFIEAALPLMADPRYLSVGGRKLLAVYRPAQIPDLEATVRSWRERARAAGIGDLLLLAVDVDTELGGVGSDGGRHGLDGSLGFPPHRHHHQTVSPEGLEVDPRFRGSIFSYGAMAEAAEGELGAGLARNRFPGVMVGFDNTPRRKWESHIWFGSNPYTFRRWLAAAVAAVADRPPDERLVFVNAWNEWGESAMLEPSDRFGPTFLLAVRDVTLG